MKYDRDIIIDALEHCTRLDGDNFPYPNCIECPVMDDCKKCVGHIPYEMKEPLLELLKEQQAKIDELIKEASGYAELLIKNEIIKDGEQE